MRRVTYSMGVSLDGYIVGPDGNIASPPPEEEIFRFVIEEARDIGVHLLGRRLYETMLYWETADQDPSLDDSELEWAAIWKPLPKVVFSTTLSTVQGNARLASGGLAEEIERSRPELMQWGCGRPEVLVLSAPGHEVPTYAVRVPWADPSSVSWPTARRAERPKRQRSGPSQKRGRQRDR